MSNSRVRVDNDKTIPYPITIITISTETGPYRNQLSMPFIMENLVEFSSSVIPVFSNTQGAFANVAMWNTCINRCAKGLAISHLPECLGS